MRLQFRHLFPVFLLLCLLLSSIAYAQQRGVKRVESYATADRHALVIGNSEYEQVGRLRNPVNDADAMTDSLQSLGPTAASSQAKSSRKKYLKSMTFLCSADVPQTIIVDPINETMC